MPSPLIEERNLRKLKLAAYVERILSAAETRLADQPWWNSDIEALNAAVRGASIDDLALIAGTWAGLKWFDAAETLLAADWLADRYPEYAPACLYRIAELLLNYGPHAIRGRLPVRVPRSRVLLTNGNRRLVRFPREHAGRRVYWAADAVTADVAWLDAHGRRLDVQSQPVHCILAPAGSDADVPLFDETRGDLQPLNSLSFDAVAAYISGLPRAALQLVHEGQGLIALSDTELRDGDTRPRLSVRPAYLVGREYRDVARQLVAWLGAEFVRLYSSTQVARDIARLAIQHVWGRLEVSGQAEWLWRAASNPMPASRLNPVREAVHASVMATFAELADVIRPLPLLPSTLALLEPFNERAAVKTKNNGLVPANWYVLDHVAALDAHRREHVVDSLSKGDPTEGELFVLAACRYADGKFVSALDYARQCARFDTDCMEYQYVAAFCRRHLGDAAGFEARVFGDVPRSV